MRFFSPCRRASILCLLLLGISLHSARAGRLSPPEAHAILDKIYSFDLEGAAETARRMQQDHPDDPLGFLLEADALWWRFWVLSAEFKYGMTDARRRPKLPADQHYFELAARASALASARLQRGETAEMQFYAGLADATTARLYGLRGENRSAAKFGVRAREHFLHAKSLDPTLADADLGLGLYNYYVDTLSGITKMLRFFMGIPGGSKQEGVRLLEHSIADGDLTHNAARFYLAMNLHRYDQQYDRALSIIGPLAEKYPSNPIFQLARGDLYAKLGRKQQALLCYRAAGDSSSRDPECRVHIEHLVHASIAGLGREAQSGSS